MLKNWFKGCATNMLQPRFSWSTAEPGVQGRVTLLLDAQRMPRAFGPSECSVIWWASSAQSHSRGRVDAGSITSTTPNFSAVRKGELNAW